MDDSGTPNPLCACGCGFEVALPHNRYIQGHAGAVRLTREQRQELNKMLTAGVSTYKIGARFGRSQSQVLNWRYSGVPEQRPAPQVLRKEELERIAAAKDARRQSRAEARWAKQKKEKPARLKTMTAEQRRKIARKAGIASAMTRKASKATANARSAKAKAKKVSPRA